MIKSTTQTIFAILLIATAIGCEQEGPAEQAGEQIDEAVQDTQRAAEDAVD